MPAENYWNADKNPDIATSPNHGRSDMNARTGSADFPYPAPSMSTDPKVDNITGGGDKPQYDAGEEP